MDRVSADLAKVQAEAKASLGSEGAQKIMQAIKSAMDSEVKQVEKKEDKRDPTMIAKPSLGSWEMAKFANNVEAGGGSLGTNVAWMYDSLAKKGPYAQVANEDTWEDDSVSCPSLASGPSDASFTRTWPSIRRTHSSSSSRRFSQLLLLASRFS